MLYLDACVNVLGNQTPICLGYRGMLVACSGYGIQGYLCMPSIEMTIKGSTFYSETIGYHTPHCTRFVPHLSYSQPWFFIHYVCFKKYQFHCIPLCWGGLMCLTCVFVTTNACEKLWLWWVFGARNVWTWDYTTLIQSYPWYASDSSL
jgi:hypothetical protein